MPFYLILLSALGLVILGLSSPETPVPSTADTRHIRHGLRVSIDPVNGQYLDPVDTQQHPPVARLIGSTTRSTPLPLNEHASTRHKGGYSIDLGQLYRPDRATGSGR